MKTKALCPAVTWIDDVPPAEVQNLRAEPRVNEALLTWEAPVTDDPMQQAVRYVVYRFAQGAPIDLDNASAIVAVTNKTSITVSKPFSPRNRKKVKPASTTYVVTALDRCNNESPTGTALTLPF